MSMTNKCLVLNCRHTTLRVRRHQVGCVIFDSEGLLIEGNEPVWEIMERMARGFTYSELVLYFSTSFGLPPAMIHKDLNELFGNFQKYGWFTDIETNPLEHQ